MARRREKHPFEIALAKAIASRRRKLGLRVVDCVKRMQDDRDVKAFYAAGFNWATWYSWESHDQTKGRVPPFAMLPAIARVLRYKNVRDLIPSRTNESTRPNRGKAPADKL